MSSMSAILAVFFVAFAIIFGIIVWMDTKRVYIHPPKYNYKNGNADTKGESAEADHQESEETGELNAKAIVDGTGNALATAELGFEFQNSGHKEFAYVIEFIFDYRFSFETNNDTTKVKGKVETFVNSKPITVADEFLPIADDQTNLRNGQLVEASRKRRVTLQPGEKFNAYVKFTAIVDGVDPGKCSSEVVGKLKEIAYRTELST